MQVQRPSFLTVYFRSRAEGDLAALLRGEVRITRRSESIAITLLDRDEHPLTPTELAALARLPDDWIEISEVADDDRAAIVGLAERGVLLSRPGDRPAATGAATGNATAEEQRRRDRELVDAAWDRHAAVYHYTSRWRGKYQPQPWHDVVIDMSSRVDNFIAIHGSPPAPAFRDRTPGAPYLDLPVPAPDGPIFDVLRRRCVTRSYEPDAALPMDDLNVALHTVWGAQGTQRLSGQMVVIKKTSPSAGSLHPVEVYPVVRRVAGLEPGLYHYDVAGHGLELLRAMPHNQVVAFIDRLTAGQTFFADAQVVFIMAARFVRTFWKYREHSKAYRAVLLDAAHLSQTMFLTAAELDRGAFITVAFNEADIDEALGLDPYREGAIALCGFGVKRHAGDDLALHPVPYQPEHTRP
jgi:putative peptide maturation dehydrogenase